MPHYVRTLPFLLALALVAWPLLPQRTPIAAAAGAPIYWGVSIPGAPADASLLDDFERLVGKKPSIVQFGSSWFDQGRYQPFYTATYQAARSRGAIPLVT